MAVNIVVIKTIHILAVEYKLCGLLCQTCRLAQRNWTFANIYQYITYWASLCVSLQTPRYRPWITASSLLLFSDDVMDGETAAQGYLCKSGCQVEHISRERSRVKPQSGKNLPEINKLLIKRLLFAHLGQ